MPEKEFEVQIEWSFKDTKDFESFSNSKTHKVNINGKDMLTVSAAKEFKGDGTKHNPEDLFLSALSSCHMMSYMYLCQKHKITLLNYTDATKGLLVLNNDGSGAFNKVQLNPIVTILESTKFDLALDLHKEANRLCFIANSCSATLTHNATILIGN
jgi:organic hydroperoxide reductase OsmC/OhrA